MDPGEKIAEVIYGQSITHNYSKSIDRGWGGGSSSDPYSYKFIRNWYRVQTSKSSLVSKNKIKTKHQQ